MTRYPFSVATHSYFRVLNQDIAREAFLASLDAQPAFSYSAEFDETVVRRRLARVEQTSPEYQTLSVVLAGARLQSAPTDDNIEVFRTLNQQLFGEPQRQYVEAILSRAERAVSESTLVYWDYIRAAIGSVGELTDHDGPSHPLFLKYKAYLEKYLGGMEKNAPQPLPDLLAVALDAAQLTARGWQVEVIDGTSHARVDHARRRVVVGEKYAPRTSQAAMRIAVHEVYGHALRGPQPTIAEGEGFAILLEQLLGRRYKFRRSYRYLAAALGWGVMQRRMTFREVYEILWRIMVILSKYDPAVAQRHAFDECSRVFRGGRPDIAGAVYLKDSVYFTANIEMWKYLAQADLQYNDFVEHIEGRRGILS